MGNLGKDKVDPPDCRGADDKEKKKWGKETKKEKKKDGCFASWKRGKPAYHQVTAGVKVRSRRNIGVGPLDGKGRRTAEWQKKKKGTSILWKTTGLREASSLGGAFLGTNKRQVEKPASFSWVSETCEEKKGGKPLRSWGADQRKKGRGRGRGGTRSRCKTRKKGGKKAAGTGWARGFLKGGGLRR